MKKLSQPKNAEEFDDYFEDNDIAHLLEVKPKRINIDFPAPILKRIDLKAKELGMTRQALIKYWVADRLHLTS